MSRSEKELVMFLVFLVALLFIMIFGSALAESVRCEKVGYYLNYRTEWHWFTGCIVEKPDGSKVLLKQMRDFDK